MRHEKELVAWPVPPCPALAQKKKEDVDQYKRIHYKRFHAEIISIGPDDTLAVTTFDEKGEAEYRFFQQEDKCGMQVFKPETYNYSRDRKPGNFYTASLDNTYPQVLCRWWHSDELRMYSTKASCKVVYRFLRKKEISGNPIVLLAQKQNDDRRKKIEERDERSREKLRQAFAGVSKEIPPEFEQFCEEVPLRPHRFFFYEYTGRKEQVGICSHCMKQAALPDIR